MACGQSPTAKRRLHFWLRLAERYVHSVDLGGLSLVELGKRTARASWRDAVFGQGSRMAFYHFLAIFPALLLLLALAALLPDRGVQLKDTILDLARQVLPRDAAMLFRDTLNELTKQALSPVQIVPAFFGALWAAGNGMWALVFGLNTAYEVQERRPWWKLAAIIGGLTTALAIACSISLCLILFGAKILGVLPGQTQSTFPRSAFGLPALRWAIIVTLLLFSFALIYRYAPNLRDHQWRWSTPGALFALVWWIASTIGVRFYFEHVNDYHRAYGHLNRVVMLLLWLYFSNGAILIGGEMNSEIEKAGGQCSKGDSRSAGSGALGDRSGS
ncbi:MAG: YihY/virulence factor BrkB family protein [Bryobacteraceae bacterium]